MWSASLPNHRLALSYSFDPDGPETLHEGTTEKFDEGATNHYDEYLNYSAFDHALTKPNITFRRDGCGGAVHSNERKLNEEAFRLGRGPMFSEFLDGFEQSRKGGTKWVEWKIDDALALHPNDVSLLGWQGGDALAFIKERPDLFNWCSCEWDTDSCQRVLRIQQKSSPKCRFKSTCGGLIEASACALRDLNCALHS